MNYPVRKLLRLRNHDYSSESIYYVTICAEGRQYLFGYKQYDEIIYSPIGLVVRESWERIASIYEGILLDEFIVMPNHIHGIIVYENSEKDEKIKPLDRVIRNFKSFTTHEYYKDISRPTPNLWERGYYERIIRYNELDSIRDYIRNNIPNWENDRFFTLEMNYRASLHSE